MTILDFKKDLLKRNQWENPIDLSLSSLDACQVAIELIVTGQSVGIQPVVLRNLSFFGRLSSNDWLQVIQKVFELENKHMMGMINFVDTCFKYLRVDIRPLLQGGVGLQKEKSNFVLDYYLDCPFCLYIEESEILDLYEKYNVLEGDLKSVRDSLIGLPDVILLHSVGQ